MEDSGSPSFGEPLVWFGWAKAAPPKVRSTLGVRGGYLRAVLAFALCKISAINLFAFWIPATVVTLICTPLTVILAALKPTLSSPLSPPEDPLS